MTTKVLRDLIFVTIVLLPLYVLRGYLFGIPTTLLEIFVLGTTGIWLIDKIIKKDLPNLNNLLIWPGVLFATAAVVSIFVSPDFRAGAGIFKAYIAEPILFFFVTLDVARKVKSKNFIITGLISAAIWLSLLVVIQVFTGRFVVEPFEFSLGRATGVYNSANSLGLFLGPVFALVLSLLLFEKNRIISRVFYFGSLLLMILAIIFSKSDGAKVGILAVSSSAFIIWLLGKNLRKFIKVLLPLVIIFVLAAFAFLFRFDLTPEVKDYVYSKGNTIQVRLYVWQGTLDLITDRPVFGAGLAGFKPIYFWHYRLPQYDEALQYPHNLFLNFYAEMGILGLIGFVWIFSKLVLISVSRAKKSPLAIGIFLSLIYILVHGLVDVPYFKNDLSIQFWLLAALLVI